MKYNIILKPVMLVGFLLLLSSCSDWLKVNPVDQIIDEQVYSSETNIQKALNGIYLGMGANTLYGVNLSTNTIEVLAQQYSIAPETSDSRSLKYYVSNYSYSEQTVKNHFASIWGGSYGQILSINLFIEKLTPVDASVISKSKKDILLGEAYALRAYMHFDLLRLFGPVYLTDSTTVSIPYYTDAKVSLRDREPANNIMDKVINDIDAALNLLKNDPVITNGVMVGNVGDNVDFYAYRNRRMNYYATSALKARALLYRNNKQAAGDLAAALLLESEPNKFPWTTKEEFGVTVYPDRIFSSEVLFGVHSSDMYTNFANYFSAGINDPTGLYAMNTSNVKYMFDGADLGASPDWRVANWVTYVQSTYVCAYKFSRSMREAPFWYFQPLIRKSELYLIMAECRSDASPLNEVRTHRGLKTLAEINPAFNLQEEIKKEYIRETFGEGQLFYYYKRNYITSLRNGTQPVTGTSTITMNKNMYVVPVPDAELER